MQASVRRFWLLHKTINRGNGTECLLRCCSAARILHSERPAWACDCRSYGWVAQLAEQWTENPRVGGSIPPPASPPFRRENTRETRLFWSAIFTASRIKALRAFTYSQLWPTGGGSRR